MNYQVLARKWRPKKFSEVVGQQHIITAIIHSFLLKKIHHAYILIGTRGTGKTTIARLLAKGLNCINRTKSIIICGECKNCKDIESSCFVDLIEIDAASRTKVEETRDFLDTVQYMPSIGYFKIYLIDEVHMLSKHSFNALLKILEEPPVHVKFILITTEYKKIPETILSRCLQFYLKPLNIAQIITQLTYIFKIENITIDKLALESVAYAARGSMRDALNLSEKAIILGNNKITIDVINKMFGIINIEYPLCLIENLVDSNINRILHQIDYYSILGVNWDQLLSEMLIILKRIAVIQLLPNSLITKKNVNQMQSINKRIHALSYRIISENVQLYYQILLLGRRELPYAPNHRIGIEMTMLRALAFKPMVENNVSNVYKKEENIIYTINKHSNSNIVKDSNIVNEMHNNINDHQNTTALHHTNNSTLHVNLKNNIHNFKDTQSNQLIPTVSIFNIHSNTTTQLIKARSSLLKHKECNKLNKDTSDFITKSYKKTTTNILKRFSNINIKNVKNDVLHINKDYVNPKKINDIRMLHNNFCKKTKKIIPTFIKEILLQVIKSDPWMLQIYRLSLSKLAKKMAMNSWKEDITINKICLHVRSNYYYLNSVELQNTIQKSLSNYMKNSIQLFIKKDDNITNKTPVENIYILYKEKISKTKQELSQDPYLNTIKKFFDAEFNEDDIKII